MRMARYDLTPREWDRWITGNWDGNYGEPKEDVTMETAELIRTLLRVKRELADLAASLRADGTNTIASDVEEAVTCVSNALGWFDSNAVEDADDSDPRL